MAKQNEQVAHSDLVDSSDCILHSHSHVHKGGVNLLASVTSNSSGAAPATYADMPDMTSGSVFVVDNDSVVMLIACVTLDAVNDNTALLRFAVDGSRVGPELQIFSDAPGPDTGSTTIIWAMTGVGGEHTFTLQWRRILYTPILDIYRVRSFQVIEYVDVYDF